MNNTDESPQDPAVKLAPKEPDAPKADDHDLSGPPAPETIKRGYEEDVYDTRTVLSVPLLVILFFVLAFGTVTVLFGIYSKPGTDPLTHPSAAERNKPDLNTRIARIGRGKEVNQPRLDQLDVRSGDARAITRPKLAEGNSPQIHPEDLIPSKDRFPDLYKTEAGRLGLEQSMSVSDDALKGLFKTQANGTKPGASQHMPSGSNAGRGAEGSQVTMPKVPEVKQPDAKKPDDKKPDDKKPKPPEPAPMPMDKGGKK